jgi:molybdate transport system substrate-binding protein
MDPMAALAGPRRWLAVVVATLGCAPAPAPDAASGEPLRVLAAASLTEVVEALAASFDDPVETSLGGSSALARQIRDGAPADVFVSASPEWIDFLVEAGAIDGEPVVLARNRLVAVAPPGSRLVAAGPRALLHAVGGAGRVGVADPGVPAGEYARAALEHHGLLDAFRSRLVGQQDVRAVLAAVERGELDAGFVYATDARVAPVEVLFAFDPASHPPIEYLAAALRRAGNPEGARRFLEHLRGPPARALLGAAGFEVP